MWSADNTVALIMTSNMKLILRIRFINKNIDCGYRNKNKQTCTYRDYLLK